ncbi:hypothetical protein PYW08_006187 [Mythimna loreyi]|uniref:Uncharacterized protein n=1 Tax=Mythimna loreyi TaxID=667449 RepID=A0ACC2QMX8_9NEOP|nr:hypothetical protein PYW08_006187 [Mythimna loreyi]
MEDTNDTFIKNGFMFIYARQNIPTAEKISNIDKLLNECAYINVSDANDKNNTILHIATQREEKDFVEFLLTKGALLKKNLEGKTPLQIAKEKNTEVSNEIVNILTKNGKHLPSVNVTSSKNQQKEQLQNRSISHNNCPTSPVGIQYQKRNGTSGVRGQFYETKLLSLVLHRALHDKEIEDCYLAANINDIGDFDDLCFRFKIQEDGATKHVICFTQAKHKENTNNSRLTVQSLEGTSDSFSLTKYFDSFLKIKQKFLKNDTKTYDPMFEGEFNDVDCYFVLYTNLAKNFDRILTNNKPISRKLHEFINTGKENGDVFQFDYRDTEAIDSLTTFMQQKCIKTLGKHLLASILPGSKTSLMNNDLIKLYHPALAKHVIELTDTSTDPNFFDGKFREEFFDSDDDLLITLKETLYVEIVMNQAKQTLLSKENVKEKVQAIVNNPSAQTLSSLIGEVIKFDDKKNKLCLDEKKIPKKKYGPKDINEINTNLQKCQITQAIVNDAIFISGKVKLKSLTFKLPHTFGNTDFPKVKKQSRIGHIAKIFYELMKDAKQRSGKEINNNNDVKICLCNKNVGLEEGKILDHSQLTNITGISGAVGNLLQFDKETKIFTFNTNEESLGPNSKHMLQEIRKLTDDDLSRYKIEVEFNTFPRTSFEANANDKKLAEEFLDKLWFYTNQANEEAVENILKKEIDYHYNVDKSQNQFLFRVHSDALFLRFHDEIQKWWLSESQARYLTKTDTIFDEAKKDIINSPVLTVLNAMFMRSLNKLKIQFDENAIHFMNLEKIIENKQNLNILSKAVILSAKKLMQLLRLQNNCTFVSLDYVHILPENDRNKLMTELSEMKAVTLVIICETSLEERHQNVVTEIIKMYNERVIVITDKPLQVPNIDIITIVDENISLSDLRLDSQTKVLEDCKICYQGKNVPLNVLIDEHSKTLIHAKFLWAILNQTKIEIGETLDSFKYNEIKDCYVNRSLFLDDEEYEVNTLNDIEDTIVVITSKPGMGKTILLTHLSLETKKIDPKPWIVRINMSAHNNDFVKWKPCVTHVMRFLCKDALKSTDSINDLNFVEKTDGTVALHEDHLEDISYELEWFIHFYNEGNIILLLDGFDRILPHSTQEGIELLLELKRANKRMWITSNCYSGHILEQELGRSYRLETLPTHQQESFLRRFWKTNLKLEKLNHQQFNNISKFLDFFVKLFNPKTNVTQERPVIPFISVPLHLIYLSIVNYFKDEMNSLSPRFLRETIKQKWRLDAYTQVDRFLRQDEEKSLELAGTPLHMYIAANYFKLQITDKVDLHFNEDVFTNRSTLYLNTINAYKLFLKNNIKDICEKVNSNVKIEQEKLRENFYQTHKKMALYAICKENDIPKLLTESEISEVKTMIRKIELGEIKSELIDRVVEGVPQFYNLLFAEYFLVDFASDVLKSISQNDYSPDSVSAESFWNGLMNGILMVCPPGVRNVFNYKLKCDPELVEIANNEKTQKIIFELILDQNKSAKMAGRDSETCLNIALREGLVNVTDLLLKSARRYATKDNIDGYFSIIKSTAFLLGKANPCWNPMAVDVMRCIDAADGEQLVELINSSEMDTLAEMLTSLYENTEMGQKYHEKIKKEFCRPIGQFANLMVKASQNNENIIALVEELPYHLPEIVDFIFGKKSGERDQGNSSRDSDS